MDFSLDTHSPFKTCTYSLDGIPLYKAEKQSWAVVEIHKLVDKEPKLMTRVELHTFHSDKVSLWEGKILTETSNFSTSVQFTASDGSTYKWKRDGSDFRLHNESDLEVAYFDHGHQSLVSSHQKLPVLRIHPNGLKIVDEIIATFVYVTKRALDVNYDAATANAIAASNASVAAVAST